MRDCAGRWNRTNVPTIPEDWRNSASTLASCAFDSPMATGPGTKVPLRASTYVPWGTDLSVSINDPGYTTSPQTVAFTATVSGGTGAYKYHWFTRWCNMVGGRKECAADYEAQSATGPTLYYRVLNYDVKNDIVVQVEDTLTSARTYGSASMTVFGPYDYEPPPPSTYPFNCSLGSYYWSYPLEYPQSDSLFRRNPCTGAREGIAKP